MAAAYTLNSKFPPKSYKEAWALNYKGLAAAVQPAKKQEVLRKSLPKVEASGLQCFRAEAPRLRVLVSGL